MFLVVAKRCREFDLSAVAHAGYTSRRHHGAVHNSRLARLGPDSIGIVIVVIGLDEVKDVLVHIPQLVSRVVWGALDFVPDYRVPKNPPLVLDHRERYAPRNASQRFALIGVPDVKPEGTCELQYTSEIDDDAEKVIDVLLGCCL